MPDRRDVDRLLDDMDDVITDWDGSFDAADWSPDLERPEFEPPNLDGLRSVFQAMVEACRRSIPAMQEAFRPFAEWASSPAGQEVLAAARAMAEAGETEVMQGCHCLCFRNHPSDARCLGEVPEAELHMVRFGEIDVPMCGPCASKESDDGR